MTNEFSSRECGNCRVWRQVKDGIVEKCPNCGDEEYEIVELDEDQAQFFKEGG